MLNHYTRFVLSISCDGFCGHCRSVSGLGDWWTQNCCDPDFRQCHSSESMDLKEEVPSWYHGTELRAHERGKL